MKLLSDCCKNLAQRRSGSWVRLGIPLAVASLGFVIVSGNLAAQYRAPDAAPDLIRLIRSEKLNGILPLVMRQNEVDMWIHAMGPDDPLGFELVRKPAFIIFTDRDGERIERAALGGRRDADVVRRDGLRWMRSLRFVLERDPERIRPEFFRH